MFSLAADTSALLSLTLVYTPIQNMSKFHNAISQLAVILKLWDICSDVLFLFKPMIKALNCKSNNH